MSKHFYPIFLFCLFLVAGQLLSAQNTPCTAISLPNNMTDFQTYSTAGLNNSGIGNPYCGAPVSVDIWFAVVAPPSGDMDIATIPGTMFNAAMALYLGPCNNLTEIACANDDNCGMTIMPVMQFDNLIPGQTYYIRLWPEGPGGSFDIRVTDGDPPAPPFILQTNGSATQQGPNCVQLTANTTSQSGCAWEPNLVDFSQPFSNTVNLNFGSNDGGADGICMVYHNDPAGFSTCGNLGGGLAVQGIQNSFIIEFDTWDNGAANGDIPSDHVSIDLNGSLASPINGPIPLANIEDGQDHEVTFSWNPVTMNYSVTFDGIPVINGNYDIIGLVFGGVSNVYCGFTASTGAASNLQTVCSVGPPIFPAGNESVVDVEICQGESYVAGGGPQFASGTYFDFFQSFNGCDSIIVTNLTVLPNSLTNLNETVCAGECVTVNGVNYCQTGFFTETTPNYLNCDSIINLSLLVLNPIAIIEAPEPITCVSPSVFLDASASTFGPGTSFTWTGPSASCFVGSTNSPLVNVTCPGVYTLVVQHSALGVSCSDQTSVTVNIDVETVGVDIAPVPPLDCGSNCVTLDASASTQGPSYTYNWNGPNNFNSNVLNPEVCDTGTYVLIIQNTGNGCFGISNVNVGGDLAVPIATAGPDAVLNCLAPNLQLIGQNTGAGTTITYTWEDLSGTTLSSDSLLFIDEADTYVLSVTNEENGCVDLDTVTITENFLLPNADAGPDQDIDCTNSLVTLDGSNSDSGPTIQYEWQNANGLVLGTNPTQEVQTAGQFYLILTDSSNGCQDTSIVTVQQDQNAPVAIVGPDQALTCVVNQVTLDGTSSSVGPSIIYAWLDESNMEISQSPLVTVQTPGTYTLIVENTSNNCVDSVDTEVLLDNLPPSTDAGTDATVTCDQPNVELGSTIIPPGANWQITWTDQNGQTVGSDSTLTVSHAGTFTLSILNLDNGCAAADAVVVDANNTPPIADPGPDGLLTCSMLALDLDGSQSSSNGPLVFEWQDGAGSTLGSSSTLNISSPDLYTLIVEDQVSGCLDSAQVLVEQDIALPQVEAGADTELNCYQPDLLATGVTNPSNFDATWLNSSNQVISDTLSLLIDQGGIYYLEILNLDNGCMNLDSIQISTSFDAPTAEAGADAVLDCNAQSVTLDGQASSTGPGFGIQWFNENGILIGTGTTVQVDEASDYTLVITDLNNGCTAGDTVQVTQDANAPLADAGPNDTLTCAVTNLVLDGSASSSGAEFAAQWEDNQGNPLSQNYTLSVNSAGVYSLTITNLNNGCLSTSNVEVLIDTLAPTADPGPIAEINCFTPQLQLGGPGTSAGSDIQYAWLDEQGMLLGNSPNLNISTGGNYTLTVFNETNACTGSADIAIGEDLALPLADAGPDLSLNCLNPTDLLNGSSSGSGPDIQVTWADDLGNMLGSMPNLNVTAAGTYVLQLFNADNGCIASDTAVVSADFALPVATAGADQLINCFNPTTILSGNGSSSGPIFNFTWTDGNGLPLGNAIDQQVSTAGTYYLEIQNNDNGCTNLDSVQVTANFAAPNAEAGADQILNCYDPQLTLSGVGSSIGPNFVYQWQDQQGTGLGIDLFLNIDLPGTYFFAVTNQQNGCSSQDSTQVDSNFNTPISDAGNALVLNCFSPEGTLDGSNSNAGPLFGYAWIAPDGTTIGTMPQVDVQADGTYLLEVTDMESGCSALDSVLVTADFDLPIAEAGSDELINCAVPSLSLDGGGSSAGLEFSYSWTDGNGLLLGTAIDQLIDQSGFYFLEVVNTLNGCVNLDSVFVDADFQLPLAEAGDPQTLNCYQPGLQLDGSASSSGPDFQYTWQDDQASVIGSGISQNISTAGWYYLQVLNSANGCSNLDSVLIGEDFVPPTALAGTDGLLDCSDPSYTLDGSASSNGPNFSYEWQNEAGAVLSTMNALNVQSPGTYILTVFNLENGCASADTAVVTTNQVFPIAQVFTPDLLTCVQLEAALNTQGSSTGSNYDYLWSTLSGAGLVQQGPDGPFVLQPGLYELIVLDSSNGCSDTATVQVDQDIVPPVADAGATLHLNCFQEDGQLDGSQSMPVGQLGFAWTTTDGQITASGLTATPTVATAGTYLLTVTDLDNGCTDQADISVTASFLEALEVAPTPPNCYGETGLLEIIQTQGGVPPYLYSIDGGAQFSSQTFYANLEAGLYDVQVQDADGCTLGQTVEVTSPPALTAFVEPQVFLKLGESYQLEIQTNLLPGQIDSILWTPGTYLDCTDCPDPITSPLDNIQYEVVVTDTAGCIVRGLTDIYVDGRSQIYIPNGFSPDGDGQNEVFMIFAATRHVQNIRAFQVFNRWGEEVYAAYNFQPNDPTYGWDGSFRGQALDPAVFVYYAEIELIDGRREVVKGDVVLVR